MNTPNTGKRIVIHKDGEEGAFHIDAMTGQIVTPNEERPQWSEGLATAHLAERTGYYEQRLGATLPETLRSPTAINYADLSWVGIDAEGDEVEIEFSPEFRSDMLADLLEIDTSVEGWEKRMEGTLVEAMVDHTYETSPTDEKALADVEGTSFSEAEKNAAQG